MLTTKQINELVEYFESQHFPENFAGGKIKAKWGDIYGHMTADGKCKKIEEICQEYTFWYDPQKVTK